METNLIFDYNNLLFRSLNQRVYDEYRGRHTELAKGFLNALLMYTGKFKPDYVTIAHDSPPYIRNSMMGKYKEKKGQVINEPVRLIVQENRKYIDELLRLMGIKIYQSPGFEADDIIANVVQYNSNMRHLIVSNDSDLYQLLTDNNVSMVITMNKIIDHAAFAAMKGLEPSDWIIYLAMVGTHNNIGGISGVGPKTAMRLFNDDTAMEEFIETHKDELNKYLRLIELPIQRLRYEEIKVSKATGNYRDVLQYVNHTLGLRMKLQTESVLRFLLRDDRSK
jgi:DNA polymerase I